MKLVKFEKKDRDTGYRVAIGAFMLSFSFFLSGCQKEAMEFQSFMFTVLKLIPLLTLIFSLFLTYVLFVDKAEKGWGRWKNFIKFGIPVGVLLSVVILLGVSLIFGIDEISPKITHPYFSAIFFPAIWVFAFMLIEKVLLAKNNNKKDKQ